MEHADAIDVGRPETLTDATVQALIRFIATQGLRAGDRLPSERELVARTGVSRLPLREALSVLKGLGIVESHQGRGVFVKQLDLASLFSLLSPLLRAQADLQVSHVMEVRALLEPCIAEQAARNRTEEDVEALSRCVSAMRESLLDRDTFIRHDMAFHQALARASGNPVYHAIMASITHVLAEVQQMLPDDAHYRRQSLSYHTVIRDAVRDRHAMAACEHIVAHLRDVGERL